jgi:hypothetical protein
MNHGLVFMESLPWKWNERIESAQTALVGDVIGDLSRKFIEETNCSVQSEMHCWRQIGLFVDSRFCKYAAVCVVLYPIHLALCVIFLIRE